MVLLSSRASATNETQTTNIKIPKKETKGFSSVAIININRKAQKGSSETGNIYMYIYPELNFFKGVHEKAGEAVNL